MAPRIFQQCRKKSVMLTCIITMHDSPRPLIISKNPTFRTLSRWAERVPFFSFNKINIKQIFAPAANAFTAIKNAFCGNVFQSFICSANDCVQNVLHKNIFENIWGVMAPLASMEGPQRDPIGTKPLMAITVSHCTNNEANVDVVLFSAQACTKAWRCWNLL